ncbi:MAG: DJ-1/PfpI family protein [Saprospiraceae bacterium]|nr:DJ-1/PfpI family protein [Saprospiraceae bacterium]
MLIRTNICLLLFVGLFACTPGVPTDSEVSQDSERQDSLWQVAFLIMDGVYNTELTAPYDIFQHTIFREGIRPMRVFTIANTEMPVQTFEGLKILPDYNYLTDELPRIDILVVPSAEHHLDTDLEDQALLDFVRKAAGQAQYVTSHCDGAFVLAQAGLLEGVASTTFPADIPAYREMFPALEVIDSVWFVHDSKFITSAGGARSFEAALYLCEHLYGAEIARRLAQGLVIDWDLKQVPHFIAESAL